MVAAWTPFSTGGFATRGKFPSHGSTSTNSEKSDDMIGTLVVMLPSNSTGGELVVEHRGQSERYQGSASSLVFVAFYGDTRHEVLPVERGYRVALTYNLGLTGSSSATATDAGCASEVADLLDVHFSRTQHLAGQATEPPADHPIDSSSFSITSTPNEGSPGAGSKVTMYSVQR